MAHPISATILGMVAGATVSMTGGALLGAYVVTDAGPAYAAAPPRVRPESPLVDQHNWPPLDAFGPIQGYDQTDGVRASGSSRL